MSDTVDQLRSSIVKIDGQIAIQECELQEIKKRLEELCSGKTHAIKKEQDSALRTRSIRQGISEIGQIANVPIAMHVATRLDESVDRHCESAVTDQFASLNRRLDSEIEQCEEELRRISNSLASLQNQRSEACQRMNEEMAKEA